MVLHDIQRNTKENPYYCIVDSGTTHSILKHKEFFCHIIKSQRKLTTIMGQHQLEERYGPATVTLPHGTRIQVKSAIFAPQATRILLSFGDIRANNLHITTGIEDGREVLHITSGEPPNMEIRETLSASPPGCYTTEI